MVCFFVITPSMIAISMFPLLMTVASDTDRTWVNIIEQKLNLYDLVKKIHFAFVPDCSMQSRPNSCKRLVYMLIHSPNADFHNSSKEKVHDISQVQANAWPLLYNAGVPNAIKNSTCSLKRRHQVDIHEAQS